MKKHYAAKLEKRITTGTASLFLAAAILSGCATRTEVAPALAPGVTPPPESFFQSFSARDRDAARQFYKKHINLNGMSIAASGEVSDAALQRTYYIVGHILAGRPDVLHAMATNGTRLIIIGKDQLYTDMPEYRRSPNPAYLNERVRGTGGFRVTSFGEENLLNFLMDRYDDESISVHEFCHTIDAAIASIDPTWRGRLRKTYRDALGKGLWKNAYAGSNAAEYWAEICQAYFDCSRINNWNHAAIASREQLKMYDPEGYELVKTTFNFSPENDWRYRPYQLQPSIIAPPAKFGIDPYYTKFTWAREFIVVGSGQVSDEALLKANDTIRRMFAYRHDILKALIADGVKLVVLGANEPPTNLPDYKKAPDRTNWDNTVRMHDYTASSKTLVVPEQDVLGTADDPWQGKSMVIRELAKALYYVTGMRPEDTNWDNRGRDVQQYEMRVKRLDERFDRRLQEIYTNSLAKGMWKGTPAVHDRVEYWAEGVLAYFDAEGAGDPPNDQPHPVIIREQLKNYDPDLYALVEETMAYNGHQDWRYDVHAPYVRSTEMVLHPKNAAH
jgi:alpha-glucosidase